MSIEKLGQYLVAIEDPRCSGKIEHRLVEVLVVAVCAVIACAESWDDIALYGRSKLVWLRTFMVSAQRPPAIWRMRGCARRLDVTVGAGIQGWDDRAS